MPPSPKEIRSRDESPRPAVVRDLDYAFELKVRLTRRRAADVVRLIGVAGVDGVAVGVRVDGGGGDPHLATRAHHTDGDLAAVGDEDFLKEFSLHPTLSKGCPGVTTSPSLT